MSSRTCPYAPLVFDMIWADLSNSECKNPSNQLISGVLSHFEMTSQRWGRDLLRRSQRGVRQEQPNKAGFAVFYLFTFPLKQALRACSQTKNPAFAGLCWVAFAVREGFEPSVQFNPYGSLANCWFQPLIHLTFSSFLRMAKIRNHHPNAKTNCNMTYRITSKSL